MNAYELADIIEDDMEDGFGMGFLRDAVSMIREQADQLTKYEQVLQSIANEQVELSHDKIKWQCEDHIRWAREALE